MKKIQENIIQHKFKIDKEKRASIKNQTPVLIWFTGLSGSGKSTIANEVDIYLHENKYHTYILDGDNTRKGINADLDFSKKDRKENIRRVGEIANLFLDAGLIVLASFISPFEKDREMLKHLVGKENFIEIFVNCPIEVCEERDTKGLYAKVKKGEIKNFTGIDSPFEVPQNPQITIQSDRESVSESVQKVIQYLIQTKKITPNEV